MNKAILSFSGVLLTLTLLSGIALTTTKVSAGDTIQSDVALSVPMSCNLSGSIDSPHTATINPGTYQTDIGTTTITTFCNDSAGYSIYAIGYSNEEYGNTKLLATIGGTLSPSNDINTGTATSGATSAWAMKLTPVTTQSSGTTQPYAPTIVGGYDSYSSVPASYTKVATLTSSTDFTIGSSLETTYAAYADGEKPAGTYSGKVKYTMVHPNDAGTPPSPVSCDAGKICYNPNASGVTDSMGDQTVESSDTEAVLWASNFQHSGYGFAGWSETFDYSDATKFHGPNETIEFTAGQYSEQGLSLYAIWVPSAGNLQDWDGCGSLSQGGVTALTDTRDNQTYAVAKLADGACWMIENLRLNNDATHNTDGTLAQGYAGVFAGLATPETANYNNTDPPAANSLYYSDTQSGTATIDIGITNAYTRMPRFNNQNTASPVSNMTSVNSNVYSYGNYYTWSAALANTNDYTGPTATVDGKTSETANTSICPSGWRLPYGRSTGNGATAGGFSKLDIELGGDGAFSGFSTTPTGAEMSKLWRKYPYNFIYPGYFYASSLAERGSKGIYWSSTADSSYNGYHLLLESSYVYPGIYSNNKYGGRSVRCVVDVYVNET